VKLFIFTHHRLVDTSLGIHEAALLLEGSWPWDASGGVRRALDDSIDARFDWIDPQAAELAEELAETLPADTVQPERGGTGVSPVLRQKHGQDARATHAELAKVSPAYLNARSLRYYLVKLLRVVAYFTEVCPLEPGDRLELVAARGRDEDYADLFEQLCRATGASLRVTWKEQDQAASPALPPNHRWRRWLGGIARLLEPTMSGAASRPRAVLCGNPRLLEPVCRELLGRGCRVWWLYDRFAVHSWLRWRAAGVGQLVCNTNLGRRNHLSAHLPEQLCCRNVNLAPSLGRWLAERLRTHGRRQARALERIEAHFHRVRPDTLILDEDATPFARSAVAVARQCGATSYVVQHAATTIRFGFSPLAADRFLAWGRSSKQQMVDWGVPPERILVTGSPQHDKLLAKLAGDVRQATLHRVAVPSALARGGTGVSPVPRQKHGQDARATHRHGQDACHRPPRILLLMTMPPRDARPDSVAFHLTRRSYAKMLRTAYASLTRIPGVRVVMKLHPRAAVDPIARATMADFPSVHTQVVRRGSVANWLAGTDCVLSCMSSAGVEATLYGVPVIQLLPPGSGDVLPHRQWGFFGTARTQAELGDLLDGVLSGDWQHERLADGNVFANLDHPAAARAAELILGADESMLTIEERRESNPRVATRGLK
jgi:hypothetical protein